MKKVLFFLATIAVFAATSCNDDEIPVERTGTVEVNFVAEYNDSPIAMFENETYPDSENTVRFKKFQFYVSDLVLLQSGTADETELSEIELIDFTELNSAESAALGTARAYQDIPTGEYSGIRMGLGVNRDLNQENNGDYTSGDPLGQNWWQGWSSYIFAKFEGNVDTTNDNDFEDEEDVAFTLHTGSNEAFRSITLNTPITVSADENNIIKVSINLANVFKPENGETYDIIATPEAHTTGSLDAINEIMTNFSKAFTIK